MDSRKMLPVLISVTSACSLLVLRNRKDRQLSRRRSGFIPMRGRELIGAPFMLPISRHSHAASSWTNHGTRC
jgi:hypothetical protein